MAVFILSGSTLITTICALGMMTLCIISYIMHIADDIYISGIIIKLSELMDVLLFIDEQEIFPSNEDSVLSKLQNKVIKLSRVLKNKNRLEEQEHENIKRLVSDISHQLKTPLAALNIYIGLIQGEAEEQGAVQEFSRLSGQELDRIEGLVQNLLKITNWMQARLC